MIALCSAVPAGSAPLGSVVPMPLKAVGRAAAAAAAGAAAAANAASSAAGSKPPWPQSDSDETTSTPSGSSCASVSGDAVACDTPPAPAAATAAAAAAAAAPPSPVSQSASAYSASSYWDGRYAQRATHFDWFFSYAALRPLLLHANTAPGTPALHVGCGNSDLSIGIGEDGTPVVNIDISPVVIAQMRDDAATWPDGPARRNCSWEVADCRAMPQYADGAFGMVVDKGTLDAVLCSGTGLGDVRCYVSEAHRVLAPGGVFVLISLGQPETRLGVLRAQPGKRRPSSADGAVAAGPPPAAAAASACLTPVAAATSASSRFAAHVAAAAETAAASPAALAGCAGAGRREVRWARVLVYLLPKPSLYLQSEASLLGRPLGGAAGAAGAAVAAGAPGGRPPVVGKDEPVAWLGPYEVGPELEDAMSSPGLDPRDYFYAFCCIKAAASHPRRASCAAREGGAPPAASCSAPLPSPVQRAASVGAVLAHSSLAAAPSGGAALAPAPAGPEPDVQVLRLE